MNAHGQVGGDVDGLRRIQTQVGQMVGQCIADKKVLEDLTIEEFRQHSELFDSDVYEAISLETCVNKRISEGGPTAASVKKQIAYVNLYIKIYVNIKILYKNYNHSMIDIIITT